MLRRNMIRKKRDFLKENSGVQKRCACVAKPFVVAIERVTSTNSVGGDLIKELWKTVDMGPCQSVPKCWKNLLK